MCKAMLKKNQYLILKKEIRPGLGSVCEGLCTTGLQDKLVRTIAAMISSISTDSGLRKLKSKTQISLNFSCYGDHNTSTTWVVSLSPVWSVSSGWYVAQECGSSHVRQWSSKVAPAWRLGPVIMAEYLLSLDAALSLHLQRQGDNVKMASCFTWRLTFCSVD